MSLRLVSILIVLGVGVTGCITDPLEPGPLAEMDASKYTVVYQSPDHVDGDDLRPIGEGSDLKGRVDEEAIIRQAMAAHHDLLSAKVSADEEALIQQAMAAQNARADEDHILPVHQVRQAPDVFIDDVRHQPTYLLDSGDRVRVLIYGQPNLSRTYNIDGGGFISVPLIGSVRARNSTTFDLERSIADLLAAKYVKNPKVSVEISTHRPFFILGEIRRAGQYPFVNAMTVQTAVAIAGGFSARAYEKTVKLTRTRNGYRATAEVPANEPVYPGDTIHVSERFF